MQLAYFMYVLVTIASTVAQEARITIAPKSVNVSLNGVAEFNCTGTADAFIWEFNGEPVGNDMGIVIMPTITVDEAENIYMTVLQVTASIVYVPKNITCTAVSLSPLSTVESEPALLLVQGLPGSVQNLTVTLVNSTTVLISWTPPFTLKGVPILGFNVTTMNETMLLDGDTTMLYYSINHSNRMHFVVTVHVVPINQVGAGQFADITLTGLLTSSAIFVTPSLTRSITMTHSTPTNTYTMSSVMGISTSVHARPSSTMPAGDKEIDLYITAGSIAIIAAILSTFAIIVIIIITILIYLYRRSSVTVKQLHPVHAANQ